jgi:hypothetical protein
MEEYLPYMDWCIREKQFDPTLSNDACMRKWNVLLQDHEVPKKKIGGVWCLHVFLPYCGPSAAEHGKVRGIRVVCVCVCAREHALSGGFRARPALGSVVSKFAQAKPRASLSPPRRPSA